jgi:hypothetical protein
VTKHKLQLNPDIGNNAIFCQSDVVCRVFVCEYYNHTGRINGVCEIKARNMEEATTHFKFFYPKKMLWKVSARRGA